MAMLDCFELVVRGVDVANCGDGELVDKAVNEAGAETIGCVTPEETIPVYDALNADSIEMMLAGIGAMETL